MYKSNFENAQSNVMINSCNRETISPNICRYVVSPNAPIIKARKERFKREDEMGILLLKKVDYNTRGILGDTYTERRMSPNALKPTLKCHMGCCVIYVGII